MLRELFRTIFVTVGRKRLLRMFNAVRTTDFGDLLVTLIEQWYDQYHASGANKINSFLQSRPDPFLE